MNVLEIIKQDFDNIVDSVTSPLYNVLNVVIPALFGLVITIGVVLAVIYGLKMAKAKGSNDYAEAKENFQHIIIGFGIAIILAIILFACKEPILDTIRDKADYSTSLIYTII